ncbi:CmpA/NrtA family ABC transporter substrate-binding protein [Stutzerimonas zhaodongensis]|uniref:CmpA/NrtA family ABC transporter substrate-binding protein n=1 Tax=Stutzerimonas zhaodongensis TaxID=1176257 RepID=UPI0021031769|nr:CmpA/NrtA family ABC transporter substrate-binding protein [Stutzerimonas zhaodongensis]MCQ2029805.1 ABC transporter substrate-binding protein [Stutzerimonas zhaodongensis]
MSDLHNPPRPDPQAWVAGSDAPEKHVVNLGFMALTDAASLIVAATQGFAQPYGLTLNLHRQNSWSNIRDKLIEGELDAAHGLYGLIYAVHLGIGGSTPVDMAVLMGLAQNGQSISLSSSLKAAGVTDPEALGRCVRQSGAIITLAQTFPTGTHALWLYYYLAAYGIHPLNDVRTLVVPPSQMVAHLKARRIDGFCAGEPWGAQAIQEDMGFTLATSQSIWADHPEKVLGCTRAFVEQYPNTARALVMAVLEASRFIDQSQENRRSTAQLIAGSDYVNAPVAAIEPRFLGQYEDGLGHAWLDKHPLRFFGDGAVNMPYHSDGLWFMTQLRRWGLLRNDPDYLAVAQSVQQTSLYRDAASALDIPVPDSFNRSALLMDGSRWDGSDPAAYARSFALHALADAPVSSVPN